MGRCYALSKALTDDMKTEILRELHELPAMKKAELVKDDTILLVEAEAADYADLMSKAVNIFRRIGTCEISFVGFEYQLDAE